MEYSEIRLCLFRDGSHLVEKEGRHVDGNTLISVILGPVPSEFSKIQLMDHLTSISGGHFMANVRGYALDHDTTAIRKAALNLCTQLEYRKDLEEEKIRLDKEEAEKLARPLARALACPNPDCGSKRHLGTGRIPEPANRIPFIWVECSGCNLHGPSAETLDEAIILWNGLVRVTEEAEPHVG